ncbi:hypothetical protein [Rhodococcus sp. ARC_M6]|nr:hypothetical protein [Rhodococcus sp. ARC_M6]
MSPSRVWADDDVLAASVIENEKGAVSAEDRVDEFFGRRQWVSFE